MFLSIFGLAAVAASVSAETKTSGCGNEALPEGQEPGGFYNATVDDRRYLVFVPPEYAAGNPSGLVVSYHGGSRDPENQVALDQLTNPDFNTEKMIVYPEGTSRSGCEADDSCYKKYWSIDPTIDADDVSFTKSVLEAIGGTYCLDQDRYFTTGKSQGSGLIGNIFACEKDLSATFAAFAPVSGAFYTDTSPDPCEEPFEFDIPCEPSRDNVAMLEFHGGEDDTAKYTGEERRNQCLPNIPFWVEHWAVLDGIDSDEETVQLADDTPNTTITRYGEGEKKGLVSHIFQKNIGHDWPSTSENSDNEGDVAEFNATPIMLEFFDEHPL